MDATTPSAPGFGRRSKNGLQALGHARSKLTIKLHLTVDEAGLPLQIIATEGQVPDIFCAHELGKHLRTSAVIKEKSYDSGCLREHTMRTARVRVVIQPRSNRKTTRHYSHKLYQTRHIVERFFNRIKHFLRISTHYDKLTDKYLAFAVLCVCAFGSFLRM
ncbi:MAG: transposase [Burkholderia sp.]